MHSDSELKSYILLIQYNPSIIIRLCFDILFSECKDQKTLNEAEAFYNYLKSRGFSELNIEEWNKDWDEVLIHYKVLARSIVKMSIIASYTILLKLLANDFLKNKRDYSIYKFEYLILVERISFIINKYIKIKFFFEGIHDNYLDLKVYNRDIKKGNLPFNGITLTRFSKSGIKMVSKKVKADNELYFKNALKKVPTFNYIKKFPPFKFLDKIKSIDKTRVNKYFKTELTKELLFYLNDFDINITNKELLLGYCFAFSSLLDDKKVYLEKRRFKKPFYCEAFLERDYKEYLRTQGHNCLRLIDTKSRR